MTSTELERLVVRIVMDATGLDVGLGVAERVLLRTVNSVARMGQRMTYGLTLPLVGIGALAVREFAHFDDAMTKTMAVAGNISKDLRQEMAANAIAISNKGIMSATDLATTYYHLVSAGLEARDAMHALAISERFAVAGTMDLEKATLLLINAQTVLGLRKHDNPVGNAAEMKHVSDVIMKASVMTQATPEDFSRALVTKSGAAARVLNKTIEETTAVLAVMAAQGTKAELAGEHLYIVWRDTQAAFLKHKEAWERMGVSVYDVNGKMLNTSNIIKQLTNLTANMSDEQRKLTLMVLGFTDRSVAATFNLLGLGDAIADYEEKLKQANDTTNQIAKDMEGSFLYQLKNTREMIRNLAIDIGERLVPYVEILMGQVRQGIEWWNGLNDEAKDFGIWLAGIAAAAGPVILVLGTVIGMVGSFVAIVAGLVGGVAGLAILGIAFALAQIAVWAAVAGTAFAGLLYYFYGSEGFITAWHHSWEAAKRFFFGTIGFIYNFQHNMGALLSWLGGNWDAILTDMMAGFVAFLKNMVGNNWVALRTVFRLFVAFGGWLVGLFTSDIMPGITTAIYFGLGKALNAFFQFALNAKDILLSIFTGATPEEALRKFMDMVATDFGKGMSNINFMETAGNILKEEMGNLRFTEGMFTELKKRGGPDFMYGFGMKTANAYAEGIEAGVPAVARATAALTGPLKENTDEVTAMLDSLDKESLREERNVERLTAKLQEQAATYGMNTAQINAWRIAQLGGSAETIAAANATAEYVTYLKQQEKALKAADVIQRKADRAAEMEARHAQKYATPLEDFNRSVNEMRGFLEKGLISVHAFYYEFREAQEKLGKGIDVEFRARGMDAVLFNSAEFDKLLVEHKQRLEQDAYLQWAAAQAMATPTVPEAQPDVKAAIAAYSAHQRAMGVRGIEEELYRENEDPFAGGQGPGAGVGSATMPYYAGSTQDPYAATYAGPPAMDSETENTWDAYIKRMEEASRDTKRPVVIEGADITIGE